jgi:uncharacterized integral membrane protein
MVDDKPAVKSTERTLTARRVVITILVVYVVLFIILNTKRISVSFVFFSVRTQLLTALVLIAILSFLAGFFVRGWRGAEGLFGRSRKKAAAPAEAEPKP